MKRTLRKNVYLWTRKFFEQIAVGTVLFLLGEYDHKSLEVRVTNKYIHTLMGSNCLEIKVIRKELTVDEKAKLIVPKPVKRNLFRFFSN